nr:purine permease 3-like [Coffea arabica]
MEKFLLTVNCFLLAFGTTGGPLIMRLYFIHGGERVWLSAWLETGGWPIIIIPLMIAYFHRRKKQESNAKLIYITPKKFISFVVIGVLTGVDDFLYAHGVAKLPVSTYSLLIATQLAFTAFFAFILVRQKFTPYSINAVAMLTLGAGVLAMHTSSDRPEGVTKREYYVGFFMTLGASALYGFVLPLIELTYMKAKNATITYTLVLEIQLVMCFFVTAFCTAGMLVNKDFQAISREAKTYELGEVTFYVVLVWTAISWQCFFLGAIGVIFSASSLLSGIIIAVMLPLTEILAVIFYHESFKVEKALALVLSLWGFVSYFYGEIKHNKKKSSAKDQTDIAEFVAP